MKDLGLIAFVIFLGLIISVTFGVFGQIGASNREVLGPINNTSSTNLWNANSQKVADYLVKNAWNPSIGMLTDPELSCTDYVDVLPCHDNAWTTSDNVPTCWTLGDYGYTSQMINCEATTASLGAFSYNNGMRYEVYTGNPIVQGNPGDQHTILQPVNGTNHIVCSNPPCPGHYYGLLGDGTQYGIECDCWNGGGIGNPNPNAGVDIAAPQAIDAWLFGDLNTFTTIENNLVARYTSSNDVATGSTWQLGQVMFVMRVGSQDNTSAFTNMANMLWSLQSSQGYLPNTYSGFGKPGSGHDPENQDAGLLPFSSTVVNQVKSLFGTYTTSGHTVTTTKTVYRTTTVARTTTTKTAITTTVKKFTTSTTTSTQCCVTSTTIIPITQTQQVTQTSTVCCAISTYTLSTTATSTIPTTKTTTQTFFTTQTGSTTLTYSTTYTFLTTQTAYSILSTTITYSTTITLSSTTTQTQSTTQTFSTTTATFSVATFTTITQTNQVTTTQTATTTPTVTKTTGCVPTQTVTVNDTTTTATYTAC